MDYQTYRLLVPYGVVNHILLVYVFTKHIWSTLLFHIKILFRLSHIFAPEKQNQHEKKKNRNKTLEQHPSYGMWRVPFPSWVWSHEPPGSNPWLPLRT